MTQPPTSRAITGTVRGARLRAAEEARTSLINQMRTLATPGALDDWTEDQQKQLRAATIALVGATRRLWRPAGRARGNEQTAADQTYDGLSRANLLELLGRGLLNKKEYAAARDRLLG